MWLHIHGAVVCESKIDLKSICLNKNNEDSVIDWNYDNVLHL